MTDTEILNEVYRRLKESDDVFGWKTHPKNGVVSFIEQEWQKEDESRQQSKALGEFSKSWYKKDERHRGLEIGPDGTVKKLK